MASFIFVLIAALACVTANTCPNTATCTRPPTALQQANSYNTSDYVRDLLDPSLWVRTPGGNVSYYNSTTNPALSQIGVAVSLALLEPCGIILPHIHPRASKAIYAVSGLLEVGFIVENKGQLINTTLRPGMITVIPRAALHYVMNLACEPSAQVDAYNNEDPGLLTMELNIFRFPTAPLQTALGTDARTIEDIRGSIPAFALDQNKECLRRCTGQPTTAPSTSGSSTTGTGNGCQVSLSQRLVTSWNDGRGPVVQYNVTISNNSPRAITKLSLNAGAMDSNIISLWNLDISGSSPNRIYTLPNYKIPLASSSAHTFGYQVRGTAEVSFSQTVTCA